LFLWGPEEVIYLFEAFRNPRRQIGRDIFDFFSRTAAHKVSRLARNVPPAVIKKCSCFSEQFKIQYGRPSL
jgi:hypothetical protein